MELFFLVVLIVIMAVALGSGFPVAFALPGSAIFTIALAAIAGMIFEGNSSAFFHSSGPYEWMSAGVTNLRGVYWEPERDTLIAIPLFIFMGLMLQRSKVAEDLLLAMAQLFGPVPGGLGISVVFVGALLAATTGIVGATVVAMGLISLPSMLRNGYSSSLASGTIAASGTLGQIIPPSIVLIILADQLASASDQASSIRKSMHKEATGDLSMPSVLDVTSTSAGEMFLGALIPGLVLVAVYMLYILVTAIIFPKMAPAVRYEGKMDGLFWLRIALTLIPPLALIFIVLGSILTGVATVNQAGAIGAAGAVFMGGFRLYAGKKIAAVPSLLAAVSLLVIFYSLANFEMNFRAADTPKDFVGLWLGTIGSFGLVFAFVWSLVRLTKIDDILNSVMLETAKTTSLVFIILLGAAVLTAAFRAFGGEELVREFLNSLPGGFWSKFIIVMGVIFVLGFFLDFIEIAVVVVPIVAPILLADPEANITAVWLGVMIGLNIQTSFLTPPFGFALFYLRGVAPAAVRTIEMYKGVIPFILLQILALIIVGSNPSLVNYLPLRVNLLSEAAPPPKNPKVQHCLESFLVEKIRTNRAAFDETISYAQSLDLSNLNAKFMAEVENSFESASLAVQHLEKAQSAGLVVSEAAKSYKPLLQMVRRFQKNISQFEERLGVLKTELSRAINANVGDQISALEEEKLVIEGKLTALYQALPENWDEKYKEFHLLMKEETKEKALYRRAADNAYEGVSDIIDILESYEALADYEIKLLKLGEYIAVESHGLVADRFKEVTKELSSLPGTSNITSLLSKTRKQLKKKNVKLDKVQDFYQKAIVEYRVTVASLEKAQGDTLTELKAYLVNISETVGIRQMEDLPRDAALYIAKCNANHRDISLSF